MIGKFSYFHAMLTFLRCRLKQVEEIADFVHEKTHNDPHPALITGRSSNFSVCNVKVISMSTQKEMMKKMKVGNTNIS